MPSDGERARISVTRAPRSAIALLGRADAELGAHLTETVVTGTYCRCTRGVTFTGG